jgi:hypothetical protein
MPAEAEQHSTERKSSPPWWLYPLLLSCVSAFCTQPVARATCDVLEVLDRVTCADPQFYFFIGGCGLVLFGLPVTVVSAALMYRSRSY